MFTKSTEFSSLFKNPDRVIFCGYKNSGLLCLDLDDLSHLVFVSTVASNEKNSTIWFGKVTVNFCLFFKKKKHFKTISLCPQPPALSEFTQMLLNKNRRKLALISQKLIVIVDICEDFWINQTLQDAGSAPEFCQEYFAKFFIFFVLFIIKIVSFFIIRCNILHMSFFVEKCPPTILKAQWYFNDDYFLVLNKTKFNTKPISKGIFGVLYSDNVVRFNKIQIL